MRFYLVVFLLAVHYGFCASAWLGLPAVAEDGEGTLINMSVEERPGAGDVYVSITPFAGQAFQESMHSSVAYVKSRYPIDDRDFLVKSNATILASSLDGPSAGAALAVMMRSLIDEKPLRHDITITGGIDVEGNVIGVGGLAEKADAASAGRKKAILIPSSGPEDSALLDRLSREEGIQVIYYDRIDDAYSLLTSQEDQTYRTRIIYPTSHYSFSSSNITRASPNPSFSHSVQLMVDELYSDVEHIHGAYPNAYNYLKEKAVLAKSLADNGYTYSAGNEAFLALCKLRTLDGSISEEDLALEKSAVDKCMEDVEANLNSYNGSLDNYPNAELRLFWARQAMDSLPKTHSLSAKVLSLNAICKARQWCMIARDLSSEQTAGKPALNRSAFKESDEKLLKQYFLTKGAHFANAVDAYNRGYYGAALMELSMHESEVNDSYDYALSNYTSQRPWVQMMLAHASYLGSNPEYGRDSQKNIQRFALFYDMHIRALEDANISVQGQMSNETQCPPIVQPSECVCDPLQGYGYILLILVCILVVAVYVFLLRRGRRKGGLSKWKIKIK